MSSAADDVPADIGFMRSLHAALRRDLSRLHSAAAQLGGTAAPPTVLAGWEAFRAQLDNHHSAEDDDLWPVLRQQLSDPADLAAVDAMVAEHQHIPPALAGVDAALRGEGELAAPAELTEIPPPGRLVYRMVLRPRYDAQHRWQIPSPPRKS